MFRWILQKDYLAMTAAAVAAGKIYITYRVGDKMSTIFYPLRSFLRQGIECQS